MNCISSRLKFERIQIKKGLNKSKISKYAYAEIYVGIANGRTRAHSNHFLPGNSQHATSQAQDMPMTIEIIAVPKTRIEELKR